MRVFQLKACARMTRRAGIGDAVLMEAAERAVRGLVDTDLGGGLFKQRVARAGRGRSGGFRFLLAVRKGERAVFLFGFAKSDRGNIDDDELAAARKLGAAWLGLPQKLVEQALRDKQLIEVKRDDATDQEEAFPPPS